ncbi:VOC family protein [Aliikangiella sp. IMCC44632]
MQHFITWAEIPVTDLKRAMGFYQSIFNIGFKCERMIGCDYAIFDTQPELVSGALVLGEGYTPSQEGSISYLNAGEDLGLVVTKIEQLGHTIVIPKTPIGEGECGYFAQFIDTEGNKIGLYSEN